MSTVHQLLERNRHRPPTTGIALDPKLRTLVVACADHRADPSDALGLDVGDAVTIRNAGGRVTPEYSPTSRSSRPWAGSKA